MDRRARVLQKPDGQTLLPTYVQLSYVRTLLRRLGIHAAKRIEYNGIGKLIRLSLSAAAAVSDVR